jgi:hypothetical protein
MKHPGHTYEGFVPAISEWGMTEVPTSVKEDHDDVNEADIFRFTNDDIEF